MSDDWNRPERRPFTPKSIRQARTQKLKEIRDCIVCGTPFQPWRKGPGICCNKRCASIYNLSRRTPDKMGALRGEAKG